jgi:hypothetical protein
VQEIIHNAKTKADWDPVNESMGIYLDAMNLFKRFLIIFIDNKKD